MSLTSAEREAVVKVAMKSWLVVALLLLGAAIGRAYDADETVLNVQVTSADHETEEGYFTLGNPLRPPVSIAVVLRLVVAPGLLLLMSLPLIDLPGPYLLLAAMPSGINSLLVSHVYGLDLRLAAQAVAWSTAIAVMAALGSLAIWP